VYSTDSPTDTCSYIADTGAGDAFFGFNFTRPSTVYSFDVEDDGTWSNRKTFAFIDAGLPDGLHCDTNGNRPCNHLTRPLCL
jgi:gluconolactonase